MRCDLGHRLPFVERADALGDELLGEVAAADKGRAGEAKRERFQELRVAEIGFLRDQPAHAVADENDWPGCQRFNQPGQGRTNMFEVVGLHQRAFAVAGLVPGVRGVAQAGKVHELRVPGVVAPAETVQEEEVGQGCYCRIRDI